VAEVENDVADVEEDGADRHARIMTCRSRLLDARTLDFRAGAASSASRRASADGLLAITLGDPDPARRRIGRLERLQ
jgi:hypothetical protein